MSSYFEIVKKLETAGNTHLMTWTDGPYQGRKFLLDEPILEVTAEATPIEGGELQELIEGFIASKDGWQQLDDWNYQMGEHRCFVENIQTKPRLFLLGAGHVGTALSKVISELDFNLIVCDQRPEFANEERFPNAAAVHAWDYEKLLATYPERISDWFVVMTPGHAYDRECTDAALRRKNTYVGMIGSRAKVAKIRQEFVKSGIPQERVDELYSPIGIKISAQTPAEIAISIAAELVQVRRSAKVGRMEPEIFEKLKELETQETEAMIVTIIEKHGSGPREPGTRMIVDQNGTLLAGTIGGGALEMAAMKNVADLLEKGENFDLQSYDLTDSEAATLGMICGGNCRVMFEKLV